MSSGLPVCSVALVCSGLWTPAPIEAAAAASRTARAMRFGMSESLPTRTAVSCGGWPARAAHLYSLRIGGSHDIR